MKLIDVDRLKIIDNHIHYIKEYEGSAVIMNNKMKIIREDIKFSLEYKPMGEPEVKIKFLNKQSYPVDSLIPKLKQKILKLDQDGVLANLHKK